MKFGLKSKTISKINAIFAKYPQVEEVLLYGSRAKGNFKNGSDIDLAIKGKKLTLAIINKINHEIDNLLLPYSFDVSIIGQINNSDLIDHIKRMGKRFYLASKRKK
jgi:predicted nucleotidyltransferase